jgi:hypothetical protein
MSHTSRNPEEKALYILAFAGLVVATVTFFIVGFEPSSIFSLMAGTAPIWLPGMTFLLFFQSWMGFVHHKFDLSQGRVTLEIKVPQEILKSPEAMELVLTQLHQTASPDNHVQTYWDGKKPPTYGLELVSRHGDVRFYLSVPKKKFKNLAETQLYAQYPGIEVHELEIDYTAEIPWDPSRFSYFSLHFGLKKADAYPIKTYIDFGLDKMPKEEEKLDPISGMLEMLGSMGPGEYAWVQILITANRKTAFKEGSLSESPDWTGEARAEIKNIIKKANERVGVKADPEKGVSLNMLNLSETEKDTVKAIERTLGKNAFNTAIRGMYIAKNEAFNPGERIGALITGWRSYDDLNRNSIGPRWRTDFDWPWWQDPSGHKRVHLKEAELKEYKRRAYTSYNKIDGPKVMTVEELATIFHLPGKVAVTPTLARIPSKRAEAPSNLPIGS